MPSEILAEYDIGPTRLRYTRQINGNIVGLSLVPLALLDREVPRRETLAGRPEFAHLSWTPAADRLDPIVHGSRTGDAAPNSFASGHSMHFGALAHSLKYVSQEHTQHDGWQSVETLLRSESGLTALHVATWQDAGGAIRMRTELTNAGDAAVTIEHLTSFCLGGITPFATDDAPGRLVVHRARSFWSAEGRLESRSLEDMHLERSWTGNPRISERFGQVGSMPVRTWFPFVAVEDTVAGATWAAQIAWAGSWQLEIIHQHDSVSLAGGLADWEFGHWRKDLAPGETLVTPEAILTAVAGDVDDACDVLTADLHRFVDAQPAVEQDLPIIANEYCLTWGNPAHDTLMALADSLRDSGAKYLVIDAGWYAKDGTNWSQSHGDWIPSTRLFPQGLKATADAIRERGLIPGLWFEMETLGSLCDAITEHPDWALRRDGHTLVSGNRRFWDLRLPAVQEYLAERVIGLLRDADIGYMKVDYNETIGLGCDGAESIGEGLRQHTEALYSLWQRIRRELPDLVIENCASGGHRLEPSMMAIAAQGSFSDAHETLEIPIIAANLQRFILPRQSQIWAVLHTTDDDQRFVYLLAAGFLGRLCLSGELTDLSADQWALTRRGTALYAELAPIIKHGRSHRFGSRPGSFRYPRGWQAVWRVAADGKRAFAVVHSFADCPADATFAIGHGWHVSALYAADDRVATIAGEALRVEIPAPFSACVVVCDRV